MPQSASRPDPDYSRNPEYAIAALLHMLVRFPMVDCRTMADSITAHLNFVARDPRLSDPVRIAAAQSVCEWEAMIAMRSILDRQHDRMN
jgi:hypothetical protein